MYGFHSVEIVKKADDINKQCSYAHHYGGYGDLEILMKTSIDNGKGNSSAYAHRRHKEYAAHSWHCILVYFATVWLVENTTFVA